MKHNGGVISKTGCLSRRNLHELAAKLLTASISPISPSGFLQLLYLTKMTILEQLIIDTFNALLEKVKKGNLELGSDIQAFVKEVNDPNEIALEVAKATCTHVETMAKAADNLRHLEYVVRSFCVSFLSPRYSRLSVI